MLIIIIFRQFNLTMGLSSDLKEKNTNLKKDYKNLIDKNKEKEKRLNEIKNDLSGIEIQKLMEENAKMSDEYNNLLKLCPNLENLCNNLTKENNKIKCYCGQLQLMILMKMEEALFKQNVDTFNSFKNQANSYHSQINNLINSQSSNNIFGYNNNFNEKNFNNNSLNNNCNINNNNNQNVITIIFNIDNIKKYPIVCLPGNRLGNVFLLVLNQINNPNYSNIYKLKFYYEAHNITQHFLNND